MNRHDLMQNKLNTLLEFQRLYPKSSVGGSIGLYLMGVDLKRELVASDLDIAVEGFDIESYLGVDQVQFRSDNNDFDYAVEKNNGEGYYTKIDIRCVEKIGEFSVINFNGDNYNVAPKYEIVE